MGLVSRVLERSLITHHKFAHQLALDAIRTCRISANFYDTYYSKISYSQFGEDKVLRTLLPEQFGEYLDIGSGDPIKKSNSYLFYRLGWRGQLVEPILSLAKRSISKRPRDVIHNCLVGNTLSENLSFFEFTITELSTTDPQRARALIERGFLLKSEYECKCRPISSFINPKSPLEPFFLSIDIEGMDFEIIRTIDWSIFRPRVICIEDPEPFGTSVTQKFLSSLNYKLYSCHTVSSIYCHVDYLNSIQN
jgi:Methyltransferase FkbM domain